MKFRFEPALQSLAALALAVGVAPSCLGQGAINGPVRPRADLSQRESRVASEREKMFREMQRMTARSPANAPPSPRLALAQISEDFTRIQVVNNGLAQSLEAGGELDLKVVAQAASEIKRRAGRLRDNLALPQPGPDERRPGARAGLEPGQLKGALNSLDRLVLSFVNNPGFQGVGVVIDAQWSIKARRDLEEIIELSGRVKACSEQLRKAARKSS